MEWAKNIRLAMFLNRLEIKQSQQLFEGLFQKLHLPKPATFGHRQKVLLGRLTQKWEKSFPAQFALNSFKAW